MFLNPLLSYINKGGAVFWLSGMGWFSKGRHRKGTCEGFIIRMSATTVSAENEEKKAETAKNVLSLHQEQKLQ